MKAQRIRRNNNHDAGAGAIETTFGGIFIVVVVVITRLPDHDAIILSQVRSFVDTSNLARISEHQAVG